MILRYKPIIIIIMLTISCFPVSGCGKKQVEAPGEDVVATYSGKNLIKEELKDYIKKAGLKEHEHAICEKHGFDHSQCSKLEPCESHPLHSMKAYRTVIKTLVLEDMMKDWAKEKGITGRKDVKHGLKHLVEEINLSGLAAKMHEGELAPDKIEMQQYYEEHRDEYKGRSFSEVEEEIKNILAAKKEREFIPKYIEKLKENAVISRNYELLKVEEPTETELRNYYESHKDEYVEHEKIKILQLKIDIGRSGSEEVARRKAEEALAKLRAWQDFSDVARKYSDGIYAESGGRVAGYVKKGERNRVFEDNVFNLGINGISNIFKDGNSFYIVKVIEKQSKRQKQMAEVMGEVRAKVIQQKEDDKYELNKFEALFSMHGKRFTLGEFKEEFSELSPQQRRQFASFQAKKNLVDQLIIKELLLEDVGDRMLDRENKEEVEDLKAQIIRQILHREEVDEKIEISDEEAKEVYDQKKGLFVEPAKAKISYIRVGQGISDDEERRARQKIEEAYEKIKGGADFASVAKEYSEDWTASMGGRLSRWIYEGGSHLGEMIEHGFHRVIFKLEPGEASKVFEFGAGFFIVQMRQKEERRRQAFEEAKPAIKELLSAHKHQERTLELQDELLEKSKLIIYDYALRQMLREEKEMQKESKKGTGR